MLAGLFIIVDEDFDDIIYADPTPEDMDPELWEKVVEVVQDSAEADAAAEGTVKVGEYWVGFRALHRNGLTFVAVVEDMVPEGQVQAYLKNLIRHYFDEVDDVRNPERDGVADVVVDIIPPWEDDED